MSSTKQTLLVLAVLLVLVMASQGLPSQAYLTSHRSYQELINVYEDIQAFQSLDKMEKYYKPFIEVYFVDNNEQVLDLMDFGQDPNDPRFY